MTHTQTTSGHAMPMTASEVLESNQEKSKKLGEVYGRLQVELLTPLINATMPLMEKRIAQDTCDQASKYLQILGQLGFDVSDAMDNLRDINLALVED